MFLFFLILLIPLLLFVAKEMYFYLKIIFPKLNRKKYIIIFSLLIGINLLLFFISIAKIEIIPFTIIKINSYVLGFTIYNLAFVAGSNVLIYLGRLFKIIKSNQMKKIKLIFVSISLIMANGLMTYGTSNTLKIHTKEYKVVLNNDTEAPNLKIALISDIHLGYIHSDKKVFDIVSKINDMNVDLVCIAGDIFDGDYNTINNKDKIRELFKTIKTTYGVYACFGNHDAGDTYEEMVNYIEECNIRLLRDEYQVIEDKFIIAGRRDSSPIGNHDVARIENFEILNPKDLPVIVIDHQPGNLNQYDNSVDLLLCGHTHKGQFFPLNIITDLMYKVDYGYLRATEDSPHVIVTSGVGSWGPPQRIGTNNEIVKINIII